MLLLVGLLSSPALADYLVVADSRSGPHREFVAALGGVVGDERVVVHDADGPLPPVGEWRKVVAVGGRAGRLVAERRLGERRLYSLIPRAAAEGWLLDESDAGIFLDTDPELMARLLEVVVPGARRVGLLLGPASRAYGEDLAEALARAGREPRSVVLDEVNGGGLERELDRLLGAIDVLVVAADPVVLNRDTAAPLLRGAYLRDVPVIGHSHSVVRAGALAALHATPEASGRAAGEWLLRNDHSAPEVYTGLQGLAVNYGVARALGLDLPPREVLMQRLREGDGR